MGKVAIEMRIAVLATNGHVHEEMLGYLRADLGNMDVCLPIHFPEGL